MVVTTQELSMDSFKSVSFCVAEFPFEFRALEVVLEATCSFLDARTRELETNVYPALDELTSKVIKLCLCACLCLYRV